MDGNFLLEMLYSDARAYENASSQRIGYRSESFSCSESDLQCRVWYGEKVACVTFRGTDSIKDVVVDLKIRKKEATKLSENRKARIHRGFYDAYFCQGFREKLHQKLRDSGAKMICFTGHSLGGAMAILAALDYRNRWNDFPIQVVTFGAPRIGNGAFAKYFDEKISKCFRVENGNDLITKLPPILLGYRHVGVKIHLGFPRVIGAFSLKEHRQKAYLQHLLPICLKN